MDLILTGRGVEGAEALSMGLVNRVVPDGTAVTGALALAASLSALPQLCLRHDRTSAIEQWDMSEDEALVNEVRLGLATIGSGETAAGAQQFSSGVGRHGAVASSD
jgi:enoyl-CoA hydratase